MKPIMRSAALWIAVAFAAIEIPLGNAQQTPNPPAAPLPAPIPTAQKVFISGGNNITVFGVPNLTYNEFHTYMKSWGRFEVVDAPAAADLIFRLRFADVPNASSLQLDIVDRTTQVVLWELDEAVPNYRRASTGRKNYDQAMASLADELKSLTTPPPATPNPVGRNQQN